MIKEILTDITKYTRGANFSIIRIVGTDEKTEIRAMTDDVSVVMKAVTKAPVPEFKGTFGLGSLGILRGYIDIYNTYADSSTVTVEMNHIERNGVKIPSDVTFKAKGNSSANYRLVSEMALPKVAELGIKLDWGVEVDSPPKTKIQEFVKFSGVLATIEKKFTATTKDGNLLFRLGKEDAAISRATIDFGKVDGTLKSEFSYPVAEYLSILTNENPVIKFSDKGFAQIDVDSGLIDYEFILQGRN